MGINATTTAIGAAAAITMNTNSAVFSTPWLSVPLPASGAIFSESRITIACQMRRRLRFYGAECWIAKRDFS